MHSTTVVVSSSTFMQMGQFRSILISFLGIFTVALGTVSELGFKVEGFRSILISFLAVHSVAQG
jgi:hypothetical protein